MCPLATHEVTDCGHVRLGWLAVSCDWRAFLYFGQKEKRGGLLAEGGAEMKMQTAVVASEAYESEDLLQNYSSCGRFQDTPNCHSRLEASTMTGGAREEVDEVAWRSYKYFSRQRQH